MLEAQEAGRAAAVPGALAREVNAACRGPIEAAGLGEGFRHRMGHGIGLDVHERPFLSVEDETPLEAGMTFTDEPSILLDGRFGVRVEDVIVVSENGRARCCSAHSAHSSRARVVRRPSSSAIRYARVFGLSGSSCAAICSNSASVARARSASPTQVRLRLLGLEQPEEEEPQRRLVADRPRRLRLAQPAAHLLEAGFGQLVDAAAARRRRALVDQACLAQPRQLRIDLAVARRPGVRDRLRQVLDERVARARSFREDAEERMAERTCHS